MNLTKYALGFWVALILFSHSARAVDKPQTMDEMWKIIEAQQKQLDAMKKTFEEAQAVISPKEIDTEESIQQTKEEISHTPEEKEASQQQTQAEVKELQHKTSILAEAVETMRTALVLPEEKEYKSAYGLGPAASKVYQVDQGLSIGGYGEINYQQIKALRMTMPTLND
ncbi:hypothetical protein BMR03_00010 [Methylococcaceae bacterium HT2]|nr:hypothetical protein BMR03_00010 [Methylococcaceae bacterium HT2]